MKAGKQFEVVFQLIRIWLTVCAIPCDGTCIANGVSLRCGREGEGDAAVNLDNDR